MDYFSSVLLQAARGVRRLTRHSYETTPLEDNAAKKRLAGARGAKKSSGKNLGEIARGTGKIDHAKLAGVERRVAGLVERLGAGKREVERKISAISVREALAAAHIMYKVNELEKKLAEHERIFLGKGRAEKADRVVEVHGHEEIAGIAEQAHKLRLVTDFDRVLDYVKGHGRAGYAEISSALGVPLQRVDECCTILEEEKEIEIIYPPIGHPVAQAIGYVPEKKQAKISLPGFSPQAVPKEVKGRA